MPHSKRPKLGPKKAVVVKKTTTVKPSKTIAAKPKRFGRL